MKKIIKYIISIGLILLPMTVEAVERVVVTFPLSFGLVYIMGISDKLVGIPTQKLGIKNNKLGAFYSQYSPNLASATNVGFTGAVNVETVLSLHPDLVISSESIPSSKANTSFLRDNGIKVLEVKAGFGSVKDWLELVKNACEDIDRPERAEVYIKLWNKNLKIVNDHLEKIPQLKRVKVTLINSKGGAITVRGSSSKFCIDLIKHAGGIVMEGDEDPAESAACAELVFKFDPDIVIDDYSQFVTPEWVSGLRAVKNKKVYKMPYDDKQAWVTTWTFNTFSPIGLLWFAKTFYPEEFADVDLEKAHEEFCISILGKDFEPKKNF